MSEPDAVRKPSTLHEAIEIIRAELPEFDLNAWANGEMFEAVMDEHFGLGMWFRNQWVHGHPAGLARRIREGVSFCHDDDVSSIILEGIWRILNGEDGVTAEVLIDERTRPNRDPKREADA